MLQLLSDVLHFAVASCDSDFHRCSSGFVANCQIQKPTTGLNRGCPIQERSFPSTLHSAANARSSRRQTRTATTKVHWRHLQTTFIDSGNRRKWSDAQNSGVMWLYQFSSCNVCRCWWVAMGRICWSAITWCVWFYDCDHNSVQHVNALILSRRSYSLF